MSIIGTLEKELGSLRAKREKQAKLVADLTAPVRELERLEAEEAEKERLYLAQREELTQLLAERDADQDWLDRLAPALPHLDVTLTALATAEDMLVSGHLSAIDLGMDKYDVNAVWGKFSNLAHDQVQARQASVARLNARIAELGGA